MRKEATLVSPHTLSKLVFLAVAVVAVLFAFAIPSAHALEPEAIERVSPAAFTVQAVCDSIHRSTDPDASESPCESADVQVAEHVEDEVASSEESDVEATESETGGEETEAGEEAAGAGDEDAKQPAQQEEFATPTVFLDNKDSGQCGAHIAGFIRFGFDENNNPEEVRKLQRFLRDDEGFDHVEVTGIYGAATRDAVMAFQVKYAQDILAPWGIQEPTGFVYLTTRKKINELKCNNQREFELTEAQKAEIEAARLELRQAAEEGRSAPEDLDVGQREPAEEESATDFARPVVEPRLTSEQEAPQQAESPRERMEAIAGEVATGVATASSVAESSLGRALDNVKGFFGRLFEFVF